MKNKRLFALIYLIIFLAYNGIVFAVGGFSAHSATFWISYAFMITAFVTFAVSAIIVGQNGMRIKDWIFGYPIYKHCVAYFITELTISVAFMIVSGFVYIPWGLAFALQIFVFAVYLSLLITCFIAKNIITDVHEKVRVKREFIGLLRADAELLCERCTNPEAKKIFASFAEEVRFSDPMSDERLEKIEKAIDSDVKEAIEKISQNDISSAVSLCENARLLLKERNKKALVLKH